MDNISDTKKLSIIGKRKIVIFAFGMFAASLVLTVRVFYITVLQSEYYSEKAQELHERERAIKAARGEILDRNGIVIATNKTVCTISVIHSQVKDKEKVINELSDALGMSRETIRKKVEKVSSREKIASNIDKAVGDEIRELNLDGVKVDEDYKRYYPYKTMASKVLGFTGADNQGIIGLEVEYESVLKGIDGMILTETDAGGIELDNVAESRIEPIAGNDLTLSLDVNIQSYASELARNTLESKQANYVSIVVMNPKNGEIYAMVNEPEFDLNEPFELNYVTGEDITSKKKQDLLNKMWRNQCINDTYEPGSTFKMITATAALELGAVNVNTGFFCPGYTTVEDRRIRCHKVQGHGSLTFEQAFMVSCNPSFVSTGLNVGTDNLYTYMEKLGMLKKTGIDVPGEAGTIIHKKENVGLVELATMSFGQSFQITPMQMLVAASAIVNGGDIITPHFAVRATDTEGNILEDYMYPATQGVIKKETSDVMKGLLEKVVSEGGGKKAYIEGYSIGGKTATSQKLPRNSGKYVSSFIGFAPVEDPEVIAICIIDEPKGIYYGGTIATPVINQLFQNILPYLGVEKSETENNTVE